jgi:hypothetical protein
VPAIIAALEDRDRLRKKNEVLTGDSDRLRAEVQKLRVFVLRLDPDFEKNVQGPTDDEIRAALEEKPS